MADVRNTIIYRRQGGSEEVIGSGGKLIIQTGGKIVPNSETQAAHIANATGATAGNLQTTVNLLLAAVQGVGILATS